MSKGALCGTLLLSGLASFANAGGSGLQWGSPRVARQQVAAPQRVQSRSSAYQRNARVVTAIWEEDDANAVQLTVAEEPISRAGDRSVVVKHAEPVYDPFEEEDRLAQLPDDPFDEPIGEAIPETPEDTEAVEEAVEDEIKRRQQAEDLFEEEEEKSSPLEGSGSKDLFGDDELFEDQPNEEEKTLEPSDDELKTPDIDLEFGGLDEAEEEAEDEQLTAEELEKQRRDIARQNRESEKNCQEELEAVSANKISSIDLSIRVQGDAGKDFPYECAVNTEQYHRREWPQITYNWKAAALCHKPLYFEQVQLERYGHSWGPYVQPIMSGAHFFGTLPILPYKMGIRTPCECVYTLGYYRPGSCAPYLIDPVPFTWRAAMFQTGVATGISFFVP